MLSTIRFFREQRAPIGAILRLALAGNAKSAPPDLLERRYHVELSPRSNELIDHYVRHVGGDPSRYAEHVPAHLFAQWGFAPMVQAVSGAPYPLRTALNGGCRLEINRPIPRGEPLKITSRLLEIDENERRAILRVEVITETPTAPDALRAEPYLIIPFRGKAKSKTKKQRPQVATDAILMDTWELEAGVGREFAALTGDINPIHVFGPYAKLSGFKGCILHGFSSLARSTESIITHRAGGNPDRLRSIEAKFTSAIVLPNKVSIFDDQDQDFFVGRQTESDAFVTGAYTLKN